ncbi:unnamed protein product [Caenorhabditis bovis]|uniref:RNA-directed DNA polymerase n=1 Tax=Caenorhabditis bovis TaxID=2654633 RepID=A0A8S1EWT3_9PELO|nr:unnamed protein product [Caenorhabditis bovis]
MVNDIFIDFRKKSATRSYLAIHHSKFGTAHLGIKKTGARVKQIATWPEMSKNILNTVRQCETCQANKDPAQYRISAELEQLPTATRPFERVHADVVGPLPETLTGNKYIFVFVCAFTKFIIAEVMANQRADTLARIFTNRVIARFGVPELLITDHGTNFLSAFADCNDYAEFLNRTLRRIYTTSQRNIGTGRAIQSKKSDNRANPNNPRINIGDHVMLRKITRNKIARIFSEPLKAIAIDGQNLTVSLGTRSNTRNHQERTYTIHRNRCKLHTPSSNSPDTDPNQQ